MVTRTIHVPPDCASTRNSEVNGLERVRVLAHEGR